MRIEAASPLDWHWLVERVGCAITPGFRAIKALDGFNDIAGMVGFDRWTDNAAELHVAVEKPIALRTLAPAAFEYLFRQCGRGVALGLVAADNAKALALDKHLGFAVVCRIRDGHAKGVDAVLLELRKEDCRFLKKEAA